MVSSYSYSESIILELPKSNNNHPLFRSELNDNIFNAIFFIGNSRPQFICSAAASGTYDITRKQKGGGPSERRSGNWRTENIFPRGFFSSSFCRSL